MACPQCDQLRINGVVCHETGCPEAWRDEERKCKECGCEFKPEDRDQHFCEDDCARNFYGDFSPEDIEDLEDDK